MPKYLTITEARQQLLSLPDELSDDPVIITRHGKPVMVAFSYEQVESILETLDILCDPELAAQLEEGILQDKAGETISWADAKARLGW